MIGCCIADVWLYTKQGDDLRYHIELADGDEVEGLKKWADSIDGYAAAVRRVKDVLQQHPNEEVEFDGDGVFLRVFGSEVVVEQLNADEITIPWPDEDDEVIAAEEESLKTVPLPEKCE